MREVNKIHNTVYAPIDDLETYRAMPTQSLTHIDPFLFLNHHGPQVYPENNRGLPFGPHPHRGFETLTYILKGDIMHWDSSGSKSTIKEGGIQWMTAGSGLIHSEISSPEFKKSGGEEEVIQLWLNLPSKHKMTPPKYKGLSKEEIPVIEEDEGRVKINLISGKWKDMVAPIQSLANLTMTSIELSEGAKLPIDVSTNEQVLFYVVRGEVKVNGSIAKTHQLVEFKANDEHIEVNAKEDTLLIFGTGEPFNEPIVAQGPFVMNTREEIEQAYMDFQTGKMGTWNN